MNKAFSNTVVLSSTVEEKNSSEEECDPKNLCGDELQKSLNDIPYCGKLNPTTSKYRTVHSNLFN